MTWTRLSDTFTDRAEVLALDDATFRLHLEAMVWSNKHLTNGHVPTVVLRRISSHPDLDIACKALTAAGLWAEAEDGWQLDWSEQETAEQIGQRREDANVRKARERWHAAGDHCLCDRCGALTKHARGDHTDCAVSWCPDGTRPAYVTRDSRVSHRGSHTTPVPSPNPSPTHREGESVRESGGSVRSLGSPSGSLAHSARPSWAVNDVPITVIDNTGANGGED
jgi:hypothetical protein